MKQILLCFICTAIFFEAKSQKDIVVENTQKLHSEIEGTNPGFRNGLSNLDSGLFYDMEVRTIITKWRDIIKPALNKKIVAEVEDYAKKLPIDIPEDVLPVTFEDSENNSDIKLNLKPIRADWGYALYGFIFTYLGGNYQGQENKLDLGFWCFLEAALLKTIPDHLASVAFHLNERGEYNDAIAILTHAKSLNPNHPSIRNNLAYAFSKKGNYMGACSEIRQLVMFQPDEPRFKEKLKFYTDKTDMDTRPSDKDLLSPAPIYSPEFLQLGQIIGNAIGKFEMEYMYKRWKNVDDIMGYNNSYWNKKDNSLQDYQLCITRCDKDKNINDKCNCTCAIAYAQRNFNLAKLYYNEVKQAYEPWEKETIAALEHLFEEMAEQLIKKQKALKNNEINLIENLITEHYLHATKVTTECHERFEGTYFELFQSYKDLKGVTTNCNKAFSEKEPQKPTDYFGKRTTKIKRVPESGKVWHIWFGFGELKLYPDDYAKLSIGFAGILSAKLKYNFRTGDYGSGIGLGLNIGKALGPVGETLVKNTTKFEFFLECDSENGIHYGQETKLRPKVGLANVKPDDLVLMRLEN